MPRPLLISSPHSQNIKLNSILQNSQVWESCLFFVCLNIFLDFGYLDVEVSLAPIPYIVVYLVLCTQERVF